MKSKKYPNLYKHDYSPNWIFRKFSKEKRKEFVGSTGEPKDEALAYKIGVEKFEKWLGSTLPSGRKLLIRDIARAVLAATEQRSDKTYAGKANQINHHILPYFGHLSPDQVTTLAWKNYQETERKRGERTALKNTRKVLIEILHRAKDAGIINGIPKMVLNDPPPAPARHICYQDYRKIRRSLTSEVRLLVFLMYHQGTRPGEALQYTWGMIDWTRNAISIPGEITKNKTHRTIPLAKPVRRVLKMLYRSPDRDESIFHIRDYNAVWDRCMRRLGMDYTIYHLRDTFITDALARGQSSTLIGKYCQTSSAMIDSKYAAATPENLRGITR